MLRGIICSRWPISPLGPGSLQEDAKFPHPHPHALSVTKNGLTDMGVAEPESNDIMPMSTPILRSNSVNMIF